MLAPHLRWRRRRLPLAKFALHDHAPVVAQPRRVAHRKVVRMYRRLYAVSPRLIQVKDYLILFLKTTKNRSLPSINRAFKNFYAFASTPTYGSAQNAMPSSVQPSRLTISSCCASDTLKRWFASSTWRGSPRNARYTGTVRSGQLPLASFGTV
jgi:hypothetical protein